MVRTNGGPTRQRIAGLDGIGVGPTTKAAPVADGELYRWLCVCLVRVQLLPSAGNAQLLRESPRNCCLLQRPRGLRVAILVTSHTHNTHTHTHHTHTHTHIHTHTPLSRWTNHHHLRWTRQLHPYTESPVGREKGGEWATVNQLLVQWVWHTT